MVETHRRHTVDEITPAGIELKSTNTDSQVDISDSGDAAKESMGSTRWSDVAALCFYSFGVFAFGVIHDFVQESVFRIEGFDYG
jgi:hypothetical protein